MRTSFLYVSFRSAVKRWSVPIYFACPILRYVWYIYQISTMIFITFGSRWGHHLPAEARRRGPAWHWFEGRGEEHPKVHVEARGHVPSAMAMATGRLGIAWYPNSIQELDGLKWKIETRIDGLGVALILGNLDIWILHAGRWRISGIHCPAVQSASDI